MGAVDFIPKPEKEENDVVAAGLNVGASLAVFEKPKAVADPNLISLPLISLTAFCSFLVSGSSTTSSHVEPPFEPPKRDTGAAFFISGDFFASCLGELFSVDSFGGDLSGDFGFIVADTDIRSLTGTAGDVLVDDSLDSGTGDALVVGFVGETETDIGSFEGDFGGDTSFAGFNGEASCFIFFEGSSGELANRFSVMMELLFSMFSNNDLVIKVEYRLRELIY